MIEAHSLDGLIQALSIFNTIAFAWLGLTVLLNADRRAWGTWVAGGGLVLGGLFFAVHTALLGRGPGAFRGEMALFWPLSWLPFVGLPYLWYVVMVWYTGLLADRRHRTWLAAVTVIGVLALGLLLGIGPLPPRRAYVVPSQEILIFGGLPATLLLYPAYSGLCVLLALLALRRPHASGRLMGHVARQRALPWLVAVSAVLLVVSLAVTTLVAWFLFSFESRELALVTGRAILVIKSFDLAITALLSVVGILVGRAVASYEIFTGKVLPRGGIRRQWRNSLVLAASFGALVGASVYLPIDPIVQLVLASLLVTLLYALHSWRFYVEREEGMRRLRPFVSSEHLYSRLLVPQELADQDARDPFGALCANVLGARVAYLSAVGPQAPLAGSALAYPEGATVPLARLAAVAEEFRTPELLCRPVEPTLHAGAVWAVPLWSERGLVGVFLLGEKVDGALYTEEELELARAAGERLIDTQITAEMARRLMSLQRTHLVETQVGDRRARRVLHDEVLPSLHAAILSLSAAGRSESNTVGSAVDTLANVHRQIAALLRASPPALAPEVARLGLVGALRQAVDAEFGDDFDAVDWRVDPDAEEVGRSLPATAAEVLFYAAREAVRNAARYGRNGDPGRALHLRIGVQASPELAVAVEDNGVGLNGAPGPADGNGHGLALHSTMMAVIGGTLTIESVPQRYTRVRLTLPVPNAAAV